MIHGQLTERDYVASQWLHMRPRRSVAVVGVLLLLAAGWALYAGRSIVLAGALAYLFCLFVFYIPWKAKRAFRLYKALAEPVTVDVREDGIYMKRQNGEGLIPWSHVVKWKANANLVLLYPTTNVFHLLPRHFFPSDSSFSEFQTTLGVKVGKAAI